MTRKFFSFSLYVSSIMLILCAVIITVGSYLLKDLTYYTKLALMKIEEKTGYQVSLDDINWSIAKGAGIRIDNLRVVDTTRNLLIFSSRKVHILTALFPIFEGHFIISKVIGLFSNNE